MATDLQTPFDAAVVIFTNRTGTLAAAVRSVWAQQFHGRVQVVVGVDGPDADRDALAALAREVPATMALRVIDPGYSTARSRGDSMRPRPAGRCARRSRCSPTPGTSPTCPSSTATRPTTSRT
jgi:hypothetical protein